MAANRTGILNRFLRSTRGAFQIEFAITFPVLLVLSFGLLEFSLIAFDYQRASEASRRAVRHAIINDSIPNTASLLDGNVIVCTSSGGTVACTGSASPADDPTTPEVEADVRFQALLATMQSAYPNIGEENVRITYESTDVGDPDEAGGILPLVTVEIFDLEYEFLMGALIGLSTINLPDFRTSVLGSGRIVNAV